MKLQELLEEIKKPTKEDKQHYKGNGTLHYVVKSSKGKILGYIDDDYVKKVKAKNPKQAAHIRLAQVEFFKRKK